MSSLPSTLAHIITIGGALSFIGFAAGVVSATAIIAAVDVGSIAGVAFVIGITSAIAFGMIIFVRWSYWSKRHGLAVFGASVGYIFLLLMTLRFLPAPDRIDDNMALFIVFLVLLPFVNAVFDYGSLGLTRWCLRRGLASRWRVGAVIWSIIDFVAALALFMALGAAMIGVLHITRLSDGSTLIDLPGFFADLAAHPGDYWWLYITFFSTLLPTFLHACLVLFSILGWARPGSGARIAGWIRGAPEDWFDAVKARTSLTGLAVAAFALPLAGIWLIIAMIWGNAHLMALWFFGQFESIAQAMGAL